MNRSLIMIIAAVAAVFASTVGAVAQVPGGNTETHTMLLVR